MGIKVTARMNTATMLVTGRCLGRTSSVSIQMGRMIRSEMVSLPKNFFLYNAAAARVPSIIAISVDVQATVLV